MKIDLSVIAVGLGLFLIVILYVLPLLIPYPPQETTPETTPPLGVLTPIPPDETLHRLSYSYNSRDLQGLYSLLSPGLKSQHSMDELETHLEIAEQHEVRIGFQSLGYKPVGEPKPSTSNPDNGSIIPGAWDQLVLVNLSLEWDVGKVQFTRWVLLSYEKGVYLLGDWLFPEIESVVAGT